MNEFVQGQRWVADAEPELGLGTVTSVEGRTVTIFFEQGDCERTYAMQLAPLTRIHYGIEDDINTKDGETLRVADVQEHGGLYFYISECDKIIPETSLSSEIQLNQPFMRLMTGQLDKPAWFHFKRRLSDAISKVWQSRLNGLLGVRADLIPHQLYVAWRACERERVRVLLADEVGLGKTIEAGMIISRLIKLERVKRVLIAVPSALQVQWLVEMVRRFAIYPELFKGDDHDFESGQIHIVPHTIFAAEKEIISQSDFDLVIVDEAHHVTPGSEEFDTLSLLAEQTPHLVLLTATPEQLGMESHFARLQLLDRAKFSDFDSFVAQEKKYSALNEDIRQLPGSREKIIDQYQLDASAEDDETLIHQLLDSHGIGRVMFRNVRGAIAGFPERIATPWELEDDEWTSKFEWLSQWLKANSNTKALVICHSIDHVFACENYLWKKHGLDAAVFHEEQSLIDRDRAAAYFSDTEEGSQVLICSEIGSEGRNFQFCSHLMSMDLPEHPDLLEQRIGRLDRIGQKGDVNIHIPFAKNSDSHTKLRWYNDILNCIAQQNPAAGAIHDEYWPQLGGSLENKALVDEAQAALEKLKNDIKNGRDALLEMNSCRQPLADTIAERIATFEGHSPFDLVETASDLLQFHFEETRSGVYSVIPSDKMLIPTLPGLPPEGSEITFSREIAKTRDDIRFVSWDAPLIQGLWELLHFSEIGSASVASLVSRQLPAGHCLLESCFDLLIQSQYAAACRPFLSAISVRSLAIDVSDKDLSSLLPETSLQSSIKDVKRHLGREIIKSKKDEIPTWFKKCEAFAEVEREKIIEDAKKKVTAYYDNETNRLVELQKRNDLVDEAEIDALRNTYNQLIDSLNHHAHLHLSAIRLIVITDG